MRALRSPIVTGRSASDVAEARVLLTLASKGGDQEGWVTRGQVNKRLGRIARGTREAAVARLIAEGAIEVGTRGSRSVRYRLTERGIRRALDLDLGPRQRLSGGEVSALLGLLRAEFARIASDVAPAAPAADDDADDADRAIGERARRNPDDAALAPVAPIVESGPFRIGPPPPGRRPPVSAHPETIRTLILREAEAIDRAEGTGGMVPIHRLRERLGGRLAGPAFETALYDVARSGRASLNKITDWADATPEQRAASIHHPVRGLLYFLTLGGGLRL